MNSALAQSPQAIYIQGGCTIYSMGGDKIAGFPGGFCQFLDNGSFISVDDTHLRYFNNRREIVWDVTGNFHHQLNLSNDRKRALTLTWTIVEKDGKKIRADHFLIVNIADGKVLHDVIAQDILEGKVELLKEPLGINSKFQVPADYETSHFNSIYEIPKLETKRNPSFIQEGNIVVNSLYLGAFILSPDLKQVLHAQKFSASLNHHVHDVQVLPDGNFLFFNNKHAKGVLMPYSAVDIVTPVTDKTVWEFTANPPSTFYSPVAGGAQMIGKDSVLFAGIMSGTFIVNKETKVLKFFQHRTHMDRDRPLPHQDVKGANLYEFKKSWEKGF